MDQEAPGQEIRVPQHWVFQRAPGGGHQTNEHCGQNVWTWEVIGRCVRERGEDREREGKRGGKKERWDGGREGEKGEGEKRERKRGWGFSRVALPVLDNTSFILVPRLTRVLPRWCEEDHAADTQLKHVGLHDCPPCFTRGRSDVSFIHRSLVSRCSPLSDVEAKTQPLEHVDEPDGSCPVGDLRLSWSHYGDSAVCRDISGRR